MRGLLKLHCEVKHPRVSSAMKCNLKGSPRHKAEYGAHRYGGPGRLVKHGLRNGTFFPRVCTTHELFAARKPSHPDSCEPSSRLPAPQLKCTRTGKSPRAALPSPSMLPPGQGCIILGLTATSAVAVTVAAQALAVSTGTSSKWSACP